MSIVMDIFHEFRRRVVRPTIELNELYLNEVGLPYAEHFVISTIMGCQLIFAGFASFIHAVMPFACKRTARTICSNIANSKFTKPNQPIDSTQQNTTDESESENETTNENILESPTLTRNRNRIR